MNENKEDNSMSAKEFFRLLRDKNIAEKNKCFTCKHSKDISGYAHLSCNHPAITEDMNVMQRILQKMINDEYSTNPTQLVVNGVPLQEWNESGVRQGYVLFPLNFDPRWLEYCLLYNNKI